MLTEIKDLAPKATLADLNESFSCSFGKKTNKYLLEEGLSYLVQHGGGSFMLWCVGEGGCNNKEGGLPPNTSTSPQTNIRTEV